MTTATKKLKPGTQIKFVKGRFVRGLHGVVRKSLPGNCYHVTCPALGQDRTVTRDEISPVRYRSSDRMAPTPPRSSNERTSSVSPGGSLPRLSGSSGAGAFRAHVDAR